MSLTPPSNEDIETSSATPILMQLPRPLLDYQVIIAVVKGDVGAVDILKDTLSVTRDLKLSNPLLALGPTPPLSLQLPPASRILWATFTDNCNATNGQGLTIVQPNHLTDLNLNLQRLSKTQDGRLPLIIGNFLDNVLSVSTSPAGLYSFLYRLFTRIRTNEQTAFLLATEGMTDHRLEAHLLDHLHNQYACWDDAGNPIPKLEGEYYATPNRAQKFGRPQHFLFEEPIKTY